MIRLGVNVDHVATVRQARLAKFPDPVEAARLAEKAGANSITVHLREDRRHIQEHDVRRLMERKETKVNLEMAVTRAMVRFAETVRPQHACFVPEKRQELTTEGGLDVVRHRRKISDAVARLQALNIQVALFIDPVKEQIECAMETGAHAIEIHTGAYCDAVGAKRERELRKIVTGAQLAERLGLEVHGGHGLDYENVRPVARIAEIVELNIGHSIIARAVMVGMRRAVLEMKQLLKRGSN